MVITGHSTPKPKPLAQVVFNNLLGGCINDCKMDLAKALGFNV